VLLLVVNLSGDVYSKQGVTKLGRSAAAVVNLSGDVYAKQGVTKLGRSTYSVANCFQVTFILNKG
jgi:hypothetical protein